MFNWSLVNTPGFIKLFFPKEIVETKYRSLYEIPYLTIQKSIEKLDPQIHKEILILPTRNLHRSLQLIKKLERIYPGQVIVFPDQDCPESFSEIKSLCRNPLGKMRTHGEYIHPLMKFIKKNSNLFNPVDAGSYKLSEGEAFIKHANGNIEYLSRLDLKQLVKKLEKEK